MARIAGVDIPRNKQVEVALTYIYGIGRSRSQEILAQADVDGEVVRHRDRRDLALLGAGEGRPGIPLAIAQPL